MHALSMPYPSHIWVAFWLLRPIHALSPWWTKWPHPLLLRDSNDFAIHYFPLQPFYNITKSSKAPLLGKDPFLSKFYFLQWRGAAPLNTAPAPEITPDIMPGEDAMYEKMTNRFWLIIAHKARVWDSFQWNTSFVQIVRCGDLAWHCKQIDGLQSRVQALHPWGYITLSHFKEHGYLEPNKRMKFFWEDIWDFPEC